MELKAQNKIKKKETLLLSGDCTNSFQKVDNSCLSGKNNDQFFSKTKHALSDSTFNLIFSFRVARRMTFFSVNLRHHLPTFWDNTASKQKTFCTHKKTTTLKKIQKKKTKQESTGRKIRSCWIVKG